MLIASEHADLAQLLADYEDFAAFLSGVCLGEPLQLLGDEGAPLAAAGGDDCVSDDEFSTMLTECFGGKEVRCTSNNPGLLILSRDRSHALSLLLGAEGHAASFSLWGLTRALHLCALAVSSFPLWMRRGRARP